MFGIFSSGGFSGAGLSPSPSQDLARALAQSQRQPQHPAGHAAYLGPGGISSLQALREASQRPWNPSAPMMGGTITTGQHGSLSCTVHVVKGGLQHCLSVLWGLACLQSCLCLSVSRAFCQPWTVGLLNSL